MDPVTGTLYKQLKSGTLDKLTGWSSQMTEEETQYRKIAHSVMITFTHLAQLLGAHS